VFVLAQQPTPPPVEQVAPVLFYALALLTGLSAWAVVLSSNIVRMSVYLLLTLAGAAGLYFLMDAELLAALQLIVYAGGTLILIVFGVMLTNRAGFAGWQAKPWELALGVSIGALIAAVLVVALVVTPLCPQAVAASAKVAGAAAPAPTTQPVAAQALGGYRQVELIGKSLLDTYLAPFEVAGVLLLVVMIGAAYMARRRAGGEERGARSEEREA
jgi:NADH-quinone oxidoreductase subunit J